MRRASLTDCWLFTDERLGGAAPGDPLWRALERLPRGGGVVFRHYRLPEGERRALLARVCAVACRRGLVVVGSGIAAPDGAHLSAHANWRGRRPSRGLVTASAHGRRELLAAFRAGADLVFLSPLFPTESHPGAQTLGPLRFGLLVRGAPGPVAALGGMTAERMRRLKPLGAAGFGAIGYWTG
jgi:thiamine-phosphate pyrophosphorylase